MITKFDPAPIVCVTMYVEENLTDNSSSSTPSSSTLLSLITIQQYKLSGGSVVELTDDCILVSKYFLLEEKRIGLAHVRRLLFAAKDRIEIYTDTFM